jgi:hypothetical protein
VAAHLVALGQPKARLRARVAGTGAQLDPALRLAPSDARSIVLLLPDPRELMREDIDPDALQYQELCGVKR